MKTLGYILLILTLTSFWSCRFSKPLIPIKSSKNETEKSSDGIAKKTNKYVYVSLIRFKLGNCTITKWYDRQGAMTKEVISRIDGRTCADCGRGAYKTMYYDSSGVMTRKDYEIIKAGYMSKTLVDRSVFYENGKRTRKVNRLKKG